MVGVLVALVMMEAPLARPTALQWDAPPECPGRDVFVAALAFRTEAARVVVEPETPSAWIDARIQRRGRRLLGTLALRLPSGATVRELSGTHCRSLLEALSLVAALLIDPERARLGPLPAALPPPAALPEVHPPPAVVEVASPEASPSVAVAPAPAAVVTSPAPSPTLQPAPERRWRVGAAPHLTTAISGLPDFGGAVSLSFQVRSLLVRASFGGGGGSTPTMEGRRARYPFHLLGQLELGAFAAWRVLRLEAGVAAQVLGFGVTAPDALEPVQAWRWLPSVGPWGQAQVQLDDWSLGLGLLVGLNPRTDTYFIDPEGPVFSNPSVFVQPSLTVSRAL